MKPEPIPCHVQNFILDHIESVEQLEVLLYLASHEGSEWTADSLAKEFRSSPRSIARWLKNLKGKKLIVEGQNAQFAYRPESADLRLTVEGLAVIYPLRRVTVIEMIFNKPAYRLQSFADAFRLREDDKNG